MGTNENDEPKVEQTWKRKLRLPNFKQKSHVQHYLTPRAIIAHVCCLIHEVVDVFLMFLIVSPNTRI